MKLPNNPLTTYSYCGKSGVLDCKTGAALDELRARGEVVFFEEMPEEERAAALNELHTKQMRASLRAFPDYVLEIDLPKE